VALACAIAMNKMWLAIIAFPVGGAIGAAGVVATTFGIYRPTIFSNLPDACAYPTCGKGSHVV